MAESAAGQSESFTALFRQATGGCIPHPYQERLATEGEATPQLLNVPTGLGKTAAAVLAWLWRRRFADEKIRNQTPRRLVYCLPMRVLVEQTFGESVKWLDRLGLLAGIADWTETGPDGLPTNEARLRRNSNGQGCGYEPNSAAACRDDWASQNGGQGQHPIAVHLLMGGEQRTDWALWPERDAILIGTQDMLLSRALNRGYGMSRYRWPMHFGLLSSDCQWVFDEVQLMGSGLLTTAQLDAFGQRLWSRAKPCNFMWMSATLGEHFLNTRDRRDWEMTVGAPLELSVKEHDPNLFPGIATRLQAAKAVNVAKTPPKPAHVLDAHTEHGVGRMSLLVLNTVPAARKMFDDLKREANKPARRKKHTVPDFCLIHGRFRLVDRRQQLDQIESFTTKVDRETGAVADSPGIVLVSTQVVEAGLDISSVRLWSEIAPWSSVVQRLGRLNREGKQPNAVATFWKPKTEREGENKPDSPNAKRIGPYDKATIDVGQKLLTELQDAIENGRKYRDALDEVSATEASRGALQITADCVIRPDDILELFGTDPDLAGGFTNVSQFVRDSDLNSDTQVFWRDFSPKQAWRLDECPPHRDELCPVPFFELRRFLGKKGGAWEWNGETSQWERRAQKDIWPGMTLLLPLTVGGYSDELGWTGDSSHKPTIHAFVTKECVALDDEPDSQTHYWYPLSDHLADVEAEVNELLRSLELDATVANALRIAAQWHDWGKALPRWQQATHDFAKRVGERMQKLLDDPNASRFHTLLTEWLPKWTVPQSSDGAVLLWAKFPDVRDVWNDSRLGSDETKVLRKSLRSSFSPRLRHEAASALTAWETWLKQDAGLSALAVYLIASHHGKVRTVLRSTRDDDEVFGLQTGETLPQILDRFPDPATLRFEARHLGAHGTWSEDGREFLATSPSWTEVIAELLGPAELGEKPDGNAIPANEPQNLGPFALAYYESILVAADIRASRQPGKAKQVRT